ncbi:uncharacterized protein LOC131845910 [Achroia grisella]|uniref:uncharacterized protein LOC131845910 n=1 Tax=Achroia grisella TaxID=688607 RepID=UPI0027D24E3D|nr:uncharacterized protein LOC131845910 [Achroia grisella]
MESPLSEPVTPSYYSVLKPAHEDSGYHTSFTPDSTICSKKVIRSSPIVTSKIYITGQIQLDYYSESNHPLERRLLTSNVTPPSEHSRDVLVRRGVKRSHPENDENLNVNCNSVGTPTSGITGEIQRLDVNECKSSNYSRHCITFEHTKNISEPYNYENYAPALSHPTTPVKNKCTVSCNLSPFRRKKFARRVDFVIHSLSCEKKALQPVKLNVTSIQRPLKVFENIPNQNEDIITMLHKLNELVPMRLIVSYLSNQDIYNFTLVSPTWLEAWEFDIGKNNISKKRFMKYMDAVNTNRENWLGGTVPQLPGCNRVRTLKEINGDSTPQGRSPPTSPRTNKFKKFTKAASLDSRTQLSCIQCQHPAKVTKEESGEVWVQCVNITCSCQFCALCKSKRHPDKSCIQYGLTDASPSKRKRCQYSISSKKSKKNLSRLLA